MMLVLTGSNDFARKYELSKITNKFVEKYGDFGLEKVDASEIEHGKLLDNVASLPFLSERRMIVITNISGNTALVEDVNRLIDSSSDTTDLIIEEAKFDKRLSLYKTLKKRVNIKEFKELDEGLLAKWLISESKARGGKLSLSGANKIIQRAGNNQMSLSHELDKLLSLSPNITNETIEALVHPIPSSSIFELVDSIFSGNKKRALDIYYDQRMQRVEPQAIMGMIGWQVHVITVVKFNKDEAVEDLAKATKINPYVIRKTRSLASGLSEAEVRSLVQKALELDYRLKTQNIDADEVVQNFIVTV